MSEYVIKVDENDERWHYVEQQYTHFFGYPITDEIVRCRDCECASFDEFGISWCDENCREVKPWDFCAWRERRTINKIDDSVIDDRFDSLFDRYIINGICAWEERKEK